MSNRGLFGTPVISSLAWAAVLALGLAAGSTLSTATAMKPVSFSKQVMPIIQNNCLSCHRPGAEGHKASGLRMESYLSLMKGTKYGPVIVPGSALTSNFIVLVEGRADPSIQMPFHGAKLSPSLIGILRRWVDEGAKNN